MKNRTLLNAQILSTVAQLGHTDTLAVADCGLPIGSTTQRIDLALKKGVPSFLETLEVLLDEFHVESAILAEEIKDKSPEFHARIIRMLANTQITYISHEDFKKAANQSKACIRTGECTPYANIILVCGSLF